MKNIKKINLAEVTGASGGGCAGGVLEVNTKLCAKNGVCTSGVITWRNYGFL